MITALAWAAPQGVTTRVSLGSNGEQGNANSVNPWISADGRYVAFASSADNLVGGDTNDWRDVFLHDRYSGETSLVSESSSGVLGDFESTNPTISADGSCVAFFSRAGNLVSGDTNNHYDIFVHDPETGETTRVSVTSSGGGGFAGSRFPAMSADGRYVAFASSAYNLVPGDTNQTEDVYVHDRQTGQTARISISTSGDQANGASIRPSISADGTLVVFASESTNLVTDDTNGARDVFVHDRATGRTELVSVDSFGQQANGDSFNCSIAADGGFVAFDSVAGNLVPGDTNGATDVFLHDLLTGETARVSLGAAGGQANGVSDTPRLSPDARRVVFRSVASDLVPSDTNGVYDAFVRDRDCDGNVWIYCTAQTNAAGCTPSISASGTPSASSGSGFTIGATNVLSGQFGIFFYSKTGQAAVPFQGGTLCSHAPHVRTPIQNCGGSPPCGGSYSIDFNAWAASGADPGLVPGRTIWGQWWSRDPGFPPPGSTNLTDAVRATLCL